MKQELADMREAFRLRGTWASQVQDESMQQRQRQGQGQRKSQSQSRIQSDQFPDCGRFPYANDEIVRHLMCSIDRDVICRIRDTLFDEVAVRNNAVDYPDVYDGGELGNNNRLSPRQIIDLKTMLKFAYSTIGTTLRFDTDALVACKIILGRWLRPSEMTALFGKNASKLVMKRYSLTAADNDTRVITNGGDPRLSYAIGKAGWTLNEMTAKSRTIYIWFGMLRGAAVVYVYGRTAQSLEKARMLMNKHQATFKGTGRHKSGFHVEASNSEPRAVSLTAMYQILDK